MSEHLTLLVMKVSYFYYIIKGLMFDLRRLYFHEFKVDSFFLIFQFEIHHVIEIFYVSNLAYF